jgi:hypothetical protein
VPPDDTTLTMQDVVTKRVQWRHTSIDVDLLAAASASVTPSHPNTSPAMMSAEAGLSLSPNPEQSRLSPI